MCYLDSNFVWSGYPSFQRMLSTFLLCGVQVSGLPLDIALVHVGKLVTWLLEFGSLSTICIVSFMYVGMYMRLLSRLSCEDWSSFECSISCIVCARMSSAITYASCFLVSLTCGRELEYGRAFGCMMDMV